MAMLHIRAIGYFTPFESTKISISRAKFSSRHRGHRTGAALCDARQATGQLITEIQIRQRMIGIIESSARYAQAMEAAARQRQQSYDDG